jgi:regulation of enolase protein 1 (concanavalin A-like superfamily)
MTLKLDVFDNFQVHGDMNDSPLFEDFSKPDLSPRLSWRCEPASWRVDSAAMCLQLNPDATTDFWQRTHYGFEVDNGHFLYLEAAGDFVLTTKVTSNPLHQYDQAGLMVRLSPACWLKTSVEFEPDGSSRLGAVVTNGQYSDWSTQPIAAEVRTVWFRVRAEDNDYIVESSFNGQNWEQIRMARLLERPAAKSVSCGLYACSPKAAGYEAEFSFLRFEPGRIR